MREYGYSAGAMAADYVRGLGGIALTAGPLWLMEPAGVLAWGLAACMLLFLVYFLLYDLAGYLWHRAQHALPWLWALHSLHHSQRQVSTWTDDARPNHHRRVASSASSASFTS